MILSRFVAVRLANSKKYHYFSVTGVVIEGMTALSRMGGEIVTRSRSVAPFRLANMDSIAITAFLREEDVRDYVIHGGEGLEAQAGVEVDKTVAGAASASSVGAATPASASCTPRVASPRAASSPRRRASSASRACASSIAGSLRVA